MAKAVNFVHERRKKLTDIQKVDQRFLMGSCVFLVVVFFVYAALWGVTLFYRGQIEDIKDEQRIKQQAILSKESVERSYSIFANKLSILTTLFEKRQDKQEALAYFSSLFGPDVNITGLSYTADEEVLSFTLRSRNIFVLEDVFETLDSGKANEKYPNISKSGLARTNDGSYSMSLVVSLGSEIEEEVTEQEAPEEESATGI